MADEHNRMLLGGWPGEGLGRVFGIWIEEIDRLKSGTPRSISGLPGRGRDVAAVIHAEGAEVIATYAEDFYAGTPAVTVNAFGAGHAYYVGTRLDDAALAALMTNLGGHCAATLLDAFASADDDKPTMFIAYTIKGFGLPLAGHKDNHSGMMNPPQIAQLRASLNMEAGGEIAANLADLYDYASRQLVRANIANKPEMLDEVGTLLRQIRSAWIQIPAQQAARP
jgi:hypothetical protein